MLLCYYYGATSHTIPSVSLCDMPKLDQTSYGTERCIAHVNVLREPPMYLVSQRPIIGCFPAISHVRYNSLHQYVQRNRPNKCFAPGDFKCRLSPDLVPISLEKKKRERIMERHMAQQNCVNSRCEQDRKLAAKQDGGSAWTWVTLAETLNGPRQ